MATKAAERAREWWNAQPNTYGETDYQAMADYEAATIERCAQIADKFVGEQSSESHDPWDVASINAGEHLAAAIRSMGDAK